MDMSDRIAWLIVGCAIGFVMGYIVRSLREIKEELDEVDECVKHCREEHEHEVRKRGRNSRGAAMPGYLGNIAVLIAVLITVFAAFASQKASNDVEGAQDQLELTQETIKQVSLCTQETLSNTVSALNERTTYTVAQAEANVDLQKAQSRFIAVLVTRPTPSDDTKAMALNGYFDSLTSFVALSSQTVNKIENNPYPTTEDLQNCLDKKAQE